MLLLNATALLGLSALLIPILLHLQKRRTSREIAWAAMRFLIRSLTTRRRGLTLENLLLLFCRCLLLALFVLAMARPLIGSSATRTVLVFSLIVAAIFAIACALVSASKIRKAVAAGIAGILLLAIVGSFSLADRSEVWEGTQVDLAIVLDGTASMTIDENGRSKFEHAIDEAQSLIDRLSGSSTVSIVIAGPVPLVVENSPFHNLSRAREELAKITPSGGGGNFHDAIVLAKSLVERGTNPIRQVVLLSDNQRSAWQQAIDGAGESAENAADNAKGVPIRTYGRLAPLPRDVDNLAVVNVRVDTEWPTVHDPLAIEVDVLNGGTVTVHRRSLKLLVDEREVASQSIPQLEPGARTTLRFSQRIPTAGHHVVSGMIPEKDLVLSDNRWDTVVPVISQVAVLVVDGNTDPDPTRHSATFASLSLAPSRTKDGNPGSDQSIFVERVDAASLAGFESFDRYRIVLLCDAVKLPDDVTQRLVRFVNDGGGLWIIPGTQTAGDVDKGTKPEMDERLVPGKFQLVRQVPAGSVQLDFKTVAIPHLNRLIQNGEHDLGEFALNAYWKVEANAPSSVLLQLTSGDPLLVEQTVGRGRILLQTVSLNRRDSNFISLVTFPVLMHLAVQRLASSDRVDLNFPASPHRIVEWQSLDRHRSLKTDGTMAKVSLPNGETRLAKLRSANARSFFDVGSAVGPGIYHIHLAETVIPFTVMRDPRESEMIGATAETMQRFGEQLGIDWRDSLKELRLTSQQSDRPEIWMWLVYATLCLLAVETLLIRWVNHRRSPERFTANPAWERSPSIRVPSPLSRGPSRIPF